MKTNFEKIREMSIDEMTIFLITNIDCSYCLAKENRCNYTTDTCKNRIKQWLESECEE